MSLITNIKSSSRENKPPVIKQDPSVGIENAEAILKANIQDVSQIASKIAEPVKVEQPVIKEELKIDTELPDQFKQILDAEIKQGFLRDYEIIKKKWGCDFMQGEIHVVKIADILKK